MKNSRFLWGIAIILVGLFFVQGAAAASVGFVDFEFLFEAHPEYDSRNADLQAYAEELALEFQGKRDELESEDEVEELAGEYELLFEEFADDLRYQLVISVQEFIGQVAEELSISAVLPQSNIIYGGVDLTPHVIEAMYSHYGISVPRHLRTEN